MKGKVKDFFWVVLLGSLFMPWYIHTGWGIFSWTRAYEGFGHAYLRVRASFIILVIISIAKDIPKGVKLGLSALVMLLPLSLIQFSHYVGMLSIGAYVYMICAILLTINAFIEE